MPDLTPTGTSTADVLAIDEAVQRSTGAVSFGLTSAGFVAKPFARLLAEKLALARALFGEDLDLGAGSALRKILEISALEDARTWSALAANFDNIHVATAKEAALNLLGQELGLPRPYLEARGKIQLKLEEPLPAGTPSLDIPRGARLSTAGGHHVATDEPVKFTNAEVGKTVDIAVQAFYPGPSHNLLKPPGADPAKQTIDRWNFDHKGLQDLFRLQQATGKAYLKITHTEPFTGGELQWPDARYRQLLLRAPRSIWTADAVRVAVELVPGVKQVQIRDGWGGLDLQQSIFGNFNFIERLFGSERELGSPYYFTVLVAPTASAIFHGPDGVRVAVESALEDIRPIGIFPQVIEAEEVAVGIRADLVVRNLPLPAGTREAINGSESAKALKARLMTRARQIVDALAFGEQVRAAELVWAFMNDPHVADVRRLRLVKFPPTLIQGAAAVPASAPQELAENANLELKTQQIARFVESDGLQII